METGWWYPPPLLLLDSIRMNDTPQGDGNLK